MTFEKGQGEKIGTKKISLQLSVLTKHRLNFFDVRCSSHGYTSHWRVIDHETVTDDRSDNGDAIEQNDGLTVTGLTGTNVNAPI